MDSRATDGPRRRAASFRSRPALIAVVAWWLAAALGLIGWFRLDAAMSAPEPGRAAQLGIWLLGFAALAAVAGWGATIGSILRDTGRVRAGAVCLTLLPVIAVVVGWVGTRSTVLSPTDPLAAIWLLSSFLLLGVGTLLILLPEHLGTR